jgi:RNA-directed DNA polymerase
LQARIAKAVRVDDQRGAKRLQRLLAHSTSGKFLAVRRVTENHGRKTAGVDRITWPTPESKSQAVSTLSSKGYRALPLRRVHIPKNHGNGTRPLGIPTMRDRAMQALHLLTLDPVAECTADGNSYGFRPYRSTADALVQCRNVLDRKHSSKWVLEGDIKGCFDNISHDWLLKHVPLDKRILKQWLKAGFVESHRLFPTEAGTPQGGIISPVLANLTLDGLEPLLAERFKSRKHKVHLVRYADDFIVTGSSKELLEHEVKPMIESFLAQRGLMLSPTKTKITHITEGFDFLGWNLRWVRGGLRSVPAKKNRLAFYDKLRQTIRKFRAAPQIELIECLNPLIRGWAQYHRCVAVNETFRKMDHLLFGALWRWSRRRHPNKGKRWIKRRYFRKEGARDWVFAIERVRLLRFQDFSYREHFKIKSDANPYDPSWEHYFAKRLAQQMMQTLMGRKRLRWLWNRQEGKCPFCHQPVTKRTGWDVHHRVRRTDGGADHWTNLEVTHPTCHQQHHAVRNKGTGRVESEESALP